MIILMVYCSWDMACDRWNYFSIWVIFCPLTPLTFQKIKIKKKMKKIPGEIRAGQWSITANLWPLTTHIYHVMIIVTSDFSKKYFFIIIFRSSCMQMFFKTGVIRNFAIFTEKHLCRSLFLIKLQTLWPATLFQPCPKRDFNTGALLWILQNFYEQHFF